MTGADVRSSGATNPNDKIRDRTRDLETTPNDQAVAGEESGVLLIGGTSVAHFRVRYAQSIMRRDLTPSFWSQAGILHRRQVYTVPLDTIRSVSGIPNSNGLEVVGIEEFSRVDCYPNIAVLRFTKSIDDVMEYIPRVSPHRSSIDVPSLMATWLRYIWAAAEASNPLRDSIGIPSARWLESIFAAALIDIAPGLASGASCPETIWQSARWWHEFYEDGTKGKDKGKEQSRYGRQNTIKPEGWYAIRQPAAASMGPDDTSVGNQIKPKSMSAPEFNPLQPSEDGEPLEGQDSGAARRPARKKK